ncbi:metallophosphoesterase family protein [Massilia glaciei]|uniref:Phosphoesterase n=1 Tax=Massilia glaciei TaxID=1524097 RepID=A0A2U2HHX5_9BURK|nr:metallophosphoesterase family protein [Massilia glaciei]PWF45527.1 metallophosphoesterase [Massilia glaciei]
MVRIGVISDTHAQLRHEATFFLQGSDYLIHAGDICDPGILDQLRAIAPLTVVMGNNDKGAWADRLKETEFLQIGATLIYVIHDIARLDIDPVAAGVHAVVAGHSHKPRVEERDGVLFVNPGSAGPRRFTLPIAVAQIIVDGGSLSARIVELAVAPSAKR